MPTPRFSVIIPTLNRAHLLQVAMRSVLAQTWSDFELVIVDDGSTDDTAAVVGAFDDPRIRYRPQAQAGVSAARNAGAAAACGEFLVFLDSDDELSSTALERYAQAAQANGWSAIVAGRVQVSSDRREWRTWIPRGMGFLPGAFAVSRAAFAGAGGYDDHLRYGENTELGWRVKQWLAANGLTIGLVEEPAVVRYTQPNREYDAAKYESARWILEHPSHVLESDVAGVAAPRKRRSTYQAIVGVNAAKLGRRREALSYGLAAVGNDPRSWARYRNLLSVIRLFFTRRPAAAARAPGAAPAVAPADAPPAGQRAAGRIHGVLVTFNRPESLARMLDELSGIGLASLTVVDNAPSTASRELAARASAVLDTTYIPMRENSGPAGGYAAGMARLIETAADDDWILILDDDRLTGPGDTARTLRDFGAYLAERGAPVGAVGQIGARFDRRWGRLVRLSDDELAGPVSVDYVAGGQMLMLRVAAVRAVGVFDADLFFGFDDLDFCERLRRHGYGVYVYGPAGIEARRRFGRLGADVGRAPRRENAWRRYYSVRNHIVIMRRYTTGPARRWSRWRIWSRGRSSTCVAATRARRCSSRPSGRASTCGPAGSDGAWSHRPRADARYRGRPSARWASCRARRRARRAGVLSSCCSSPRRVVRS